MHRFFVSPDCIDGDSARLSGAPARQLARVLRARPGDRIVLFDGSGWEYLVDLTEVGTQAVSGSVADRSRVRGEPSVRVALYQAVLKSDRFELALQKGTELGVSAFVPMLCARSVPRARGGSFGTGRQTRWQRIVVEAAEQCGRGTVPTMESPSEFRQACDTATGHTLIPWEGERETGLKAVLRRWSASGPTSSLNVFIGPEGGFDDDEIDYARARGMTPVSLGGRILRAETAGIATVAAVMYELGELGG